MARNRNINQELMKERSETEEEVLDTETEANEDDKSEATSVSSGEFVITPAQLKTDFLNFKKKADRTIYQDAKKPLSIDPFDCDKLQLTDFISALERRAMEFGWDKRIMMIPTSADSEGKIAEKSIISKHGEITMEMIKKHDRSFSHSKVRERQDMHMLYSCLMDTLSMVGRSKVIHDKDKYRIEWEEGDEIKEDALSGNLLLKLILTKTIVDNKSGSFAVRQALLNLTELIAKCEWNITKFNKQVKAMLEELGYRGEKSDDTLFNLFKTYKKVPVQAFLNYLLIRLAM